MDLIYGVGNEVMHSINIRLYPNYLPGYENTFIARTDADARLSIEDVCNSLFKRGGFTGEYKDLVNYVKQFLNEVAYQLCDGYTVNTGYFSIYPNVGGLFKDERDTPDPKKNPLSIRFQPLKPMKDMAKTIRVSNQGIADTQGFIAIFYDNEDDSENTTFQPGDQFVLTGQKIKIEGSDPGIGMFFVPTDGSEAVKVTRIVENTPSKIIGIIPEVDYAYCRIEIRTQHSSSGGVLLKNLRVISSKFVLEHA